MFCLEIALTLAVSLAAFIVWKSICDDSSVASMLPSSCVTPHVISFDCSFNSCDCETYGLLSIVHLIETNNKKVDATFSTTQTHHRRSISSLPSFIAGKEEKIELLFQKNGAIVKSRELFAIFCGWFQCSQCISFTALHTFTSVQNIL